MHVASDVWPLHPAVEQLLEEALARLEAAGVVSLVAPRAVAVGALHHQLARLGCLPDPSAAAAVLALREAGWPPARAADDLSAARVAGVAHGVGDMFEREDARHVADYLRYCEADITGGPRRDLSAVIPEAARAMAAYARLRTGARAPVT
jgi:hypothetical protein